MTWVRTEDGVPNHPKHIRAGAEACWLWQCGLCYSNAHKLDGKLSKDILPALYAPLATKAKRLAAKLCAVGLWHDRGDYYEIHDYGDYQEQALKQVVNARKEYERERKREQRARQRQTDCPGQIPDNDQGQIRGVPSVTRASPVPSRPVPIQSEEREGERERESVQPPAFAEAVRAADLVPPPRPVSVPYSPGPNTHELTRKKVRQEFARRFEQHEQGLWTQATSPDVDTVAAWVASLPKEGREDALSRVLDTFFADDFCRSIHFSIGHLAKFPQRYLEPREKPGGPVGESIETLRAEMSRAAVANDLDKARLLKRRINELEEQAERKRGYGRY